jgi:hypothetical protein
MAATAPVSIKENLAADAQPLAHFEVQVIDERGDYSTRHFAWTRSDALSTAAERVKELVAQANHHPLRVHTSEVFEHSLALTKEGVLKYLDNRFGYVSS